MMRPALVLATRNAGKCRELGGLLAGVPIDLRDLRDFRSAPEVAEDGDTYLANARTKAHAAARHTRLAALADDSGLEVDALAGEPGVRSARFAGVHASDDQNVALLLDRLRGVPAEERTARFRCVIVVARPDGRELVGEGSCTGVITAERRGEQGFGYDPVFLDPASGYTFAEMSEEEKARLSHRTRACAALLSRLVPFLAEPAAAPARRR